MFQSPPPPQCLQRKWDIGLLFAVKPHQNLGMGDERTLPYLNKFQVSILVLSNGMGYTPFFKAWD